MGKSLITLSDAQRRLIAILTFVLALTSIQVQAAEALVVLPPPLQWETGQVAQDDGADRGVVVSISLNGSLKEAQDIPVLRTVYATVTAYASVPGQTDSTPFITADGSHVADGIVAANWLPFGTRIRIPQLSGAKIYFVHDRMHQRFSDRVDIWVPTVAQGRAIGLRRNYKIEVL